jgi:hypothetical protein
MLWHNAGFRYKAAFPQIKSVSIQKFISGFFTGKEDEPVVVEHPLPAVP